MSDLTEEEIGYLARKRRETALTLLSFAVIEIGAFLLLVAGMSFLAGS